MQILICWNFHYFPISQLIKLWFLDLCSWFLRQLIRSISCILVARKLHFLFFLFVIAAPFFAVSCLFLFFLFSLSQSITNSLIAWCLLKIQFLILILILVVCIIYIHPIILVWSLCPLFWCNWFYWLEATDDSCTDIKEQNIFCGRNSH